MPENVQTRGKLGLSSWDHDIGIKHVINVEHTFIFVVEHTFIFVGDVEFSYEMEIVIAREAIKVEVLESHVKCYELLLIVNASLIISPRLKPRTHGQADPKLFLEKQPHFTRGNTYSILSTPSILYLQMTTLYESFLKGPETIMTLTSDQDCPKILKDMMKHIHLEGDAVYKGYPFMEKGVELWYVEVHLHRVKGVCPKTMGQYFFISRVPRATFFDSVCEAAMEAIC